MTATPSLSPRAAALAVLVFGCTASTPAVKETPPPAATPAASSSTTKKNARAFIDNTKAELHRL